MRRHNRKMYCGSQSMKRRKVAQDLGHEQRSSRGKNPNPASRQGLGDNKPENGNLLPEPLNEDDFRSESAIYGIFQADSLSGCVSERLCRQDVQSTRSSEVPSNVEENIGYACKGNSVSGGTYHQECPSQGALLSENDYSKKVEPNPSSEDNGIAGGRRSLRRKNNKVLYDQKYHPIDQYLRPNSARTRKHQLDGDNSQNGSVNEKAVIIGAGSESRFESNTLSASTTTNTLGMDTHGNTPILNMKEQVDSINLLSNCQAEEQVDIPDREHPHKRSLPWETEDLTIGIASSTLNPYYATDAGDAFDPRDFPSSECMKGSLSVAPSSHMIPHSDLELHSQAHGDNTDSPLTRFIESQTKDEELYATLEAIIRHTSRACGSFGGLGSSTTVLAPNSGSSVSSNIGDSLPQMPSTPTERGMGVATTATYSHSIQDLPDTGFLDAAGSPSSFMEMVHRMSPSPGPDWTKSPNATTHSVSSGSCRLNNASKLCSSKTQQRCSFNTSVSSHQSQLPVDYFMKPYPSPKAKKRARFDRKHDFAIFEDKPSKQPRLHMTRHFDDVPKENADVESRMRHGIAI